MRPPSYIVDYIVEHTVGKLLEGASVKFLKTRPPRLDKPLRILDPACGSGSFLLGAYQKLLEWYRDYYENHDSQQWAASKHPPIYQAGAQGWKLTTAERKRILLDHIYGVDIDPQAVEVTKLSLLLRVLEGEKNLVLFHNERALSSRIPPSKQKTSRRPRTREVQRRLLASLWPQSKHCYSGQS